MYYFGVKTALEVNRDFGDTCTNKIDVKAFMDSIVHVIKTNNHYIIDCGYKIIKEEVHEDSTYIEFNLYVIAEYLFKGSDIFEDALEEIGLGFRYNYYESDQWHDRIVRGKTFTEITGEEIMNELDIFG